jgi:hypothetical protein
MRLLSELGRALLDAGSMTWPITWSLILGFTLSAVIQAVVPREGSPGTSAAATRERWPWLPAWAPRHPRAPTPRWHWPAPWSAATPASPPRWPSRSPAPTQVLQTQVSDHQDTIAVPSMGKAPAPTVRSRD